MYILVSLYLILFYRNNYMVASDPCQDVLNVYNQAFLSLFVNVSKDLKCSKKH